MTSKELMIDNWVKIPEMLDPDGNKIPEAYAKVISIHCGEDCIVKTIDGTVISVEYGVIEPIPLTYELIKKNGFKEEPGCYYCLDILVPMAGDGFETQKVDIYAGVKTLLLISTSVCQAQMQITYLHELQNAFSLFDIKKEIVP